MESGHFPQENHQKLFSIFESLQSFVTNELCQKWKSESVGIEDRWSQYFNQMDGKIDCKPLEDIVSYALCIPGTYLHFSTRYFQYKFLNRKHLIRIRVFNFWY